MVDNMGKTEKEIKKDVNISVIHKDIRKSTDYERSGSKIKWKIKKDGYEYKNELIKTDYPILTETIKEDEETGVLTCGKVSLRFCPRGYFVAGIWCPIAEIAFAVQAENPGSIVTIYDEVV
jgi:hypothetical protein